MAVYKCKMCGGAIEFEQGATVGVCDSCGTKQTLPTANDEIIANLHNRANTLRLKCEFDKAEETYNKILENNPNDAEAHWGMILCKYGIEYVEDPKTYQRIPTCHRTSFDAILADEDYKSAMANGDGAQRELYEAEAKEIDRIQKDILAIVKNEKPFDVFICYKETDESGKRTQDSAIANDIYYQLTQEGFKVFYAAISLEDKLGREYEPYIFAALNSAKVMLVVGSKPEYFSAVWVKNEWSRFLKLMKTDRNKLLIPCYRGMDAYELPEEFAHLQAQDMGKIGFINDITRGIKKIISDSEPKAAVKETVVVSANNASTAPLLERAFLFLEDGKWQDANIYCEKVLDIDPKNAEAYLGKLMAELQVKNRKQLADCAEPFDAKDNYSKALRFGDNNLQAELRGYITHINERNENARLTGIFVNAFNAMSAAKTEDAYIAAASTFQSISGFKEADSLAEQCIEKAETLKRERLAKEEAARLEAERKAEAERIVAEKRKKKAKKTAKIVIPAICACVATAIVLVRVIIPNSKYNAAMSLYNSGKYEEAMTAFEAINGYKDSAQIAKQIFLQLDVSKQIANSSIGETVFFGKYEQDNVSSNGQETIEWVILDKEENKALLISKYALDCQQFAALASGQEVNWGNSSIRIWLNGEFINKAFTSMEQDSLIATEIEQSSDLRDKTMVTDKVFLLGMAEVRRYFSSEIARSCQPSEYCKTMGITENANDCCKWWTRTAYKNNAYTVSAKGRIFTNEVSADDITVGVRPAMWISLE